MNNSIMTVITDSRNGCGAGNGGGGADGDMRGGGDNRLIAKCMVKSKGSGQQAT